jgi:hypothetical protein
MDILGGQCNCGNPECGGPLAAAEGKEQVMGQGPVMIFGGTRMVDNSRQDTEATLLKASLNKTTRASVHDLLTIYNTLFTSLYNRGAYYVKKGTLEKKVEPIDGVVEADATDCLRACIDRMTDMLNDKGLWGAATNGSEAPV